RRVLPSEPRTFTRVRGRHRPGETRIGHLRGARGHPRRGTGSHLPARRTERGRRRARRPNRVLRVSRSPTDGRKPGLRRRIRGRPAARGDRTRTRPSTQSTRGTTMIETTPWWWMSVALAAILLGDALLSSRPPRFISDCLEGVGFPRDWWWALVAVKLLAVAGLLAGLVYPGIGA